jgi:hypothetical protein
VALVRVELAHGSATQALLQAVDELGQGLGGGCGLVQGQANLPVRQRLGHEHVEGRGLEAEVGIEAIGCTIEAQGDETRDVPGIAAGRGQADLHRLNPAVHSEQQETQGTRAHGIPRKVGGEAVEEPRGRLKHMLAADDRLGERGLRPIDRRRNGGCERLEDAPQRLVEAEQESLETGGQRRARHIDHVGDVAQPQALQQRQAGLWQAQGG